MSRSTLLFVMPTRRGRSACVFRRTAVADDIEISAYTTQASEWEVDPGHVECRGGADRWEGYGATLPGSPTRGRDPWTRGSPAAAA